MPARRRRPSTPSSAACRCGATARASRPAPGGTPCMGTAEPGQQEGTGVAAGHRVAVPFAGAALREEENAPESRAEVRGRGLSPLPRVSPPPFPGSIGVPWGRMAPRCPTKAGPCPALLQPARGEGEGVQGAARPPRLPAAHPAGRALGRAGMPRPQEPGRGRAATARRGAGGDTPLCTGPPGDLLGIPELRQQSRVPGPGLREWCQRCGAAGASCRGAMGWPVHPADVP